MPYADKSRSKLPDWVDAGRARWLQAKPLREFLPPSFYTFIVFGANEHPVPSRPPRMTPKLFQKSDTVTGQLR